MADLNDSVCKPALVEVREPFCGILCALLLTVYLWAGQGKIEEVGGKLLLSLSIRGAQAAIVGLGSCDDVLNVGLTCIFEVGTGVGTLDQAIHLLDYALFHRLVVGIVVRVVG